MKNKYTFKGKYGNVIIEHKKPFTKFNAVLRLKRNRITLHK